MIKAFIRNERERRRIEISEGLKKKNKGTDPRFEEMVEEALENFTVSDKEVRIFKY